MAWGEFFVEILGPIILEAFAKVVLTVLRVPGVLVHAAWLKGRSLETAWEKGSKFWQVIIGLLVYATLILLALAAG